MSERKSYEMTAEQLAVLMDAGKPTPVMYLSGGDLMMETRQERANKAWQRLGEEMGFVWDSVRPNGTNVRSFTAVPL